MAGSKRSLRASSIASRSKGNNKSSSSSDNNKTLSSKKKKNITTAASGRRGRRGGDDDDGEDNTIDHVKKSLSDSKKKKSPPPPDDDDEKMSAASFDGDATTTSNEEDNNNNKVPPRAKKEEEEEDDTPSKPPSLAPPQPPPPAKIKGRFMEVKMKQLTSYFGYTTSSNTSTNKKPPPPPVEKCKNGGGGGEDNNTKTNTTTKRSKWNKRPLVKSSGEEAETTTDENKSRKKKRRVNNSDNEDDDRNEGMYTKSNENDKSEDDKKADRTQDDPPDNTPKEFIKSTKEEVGESSSSSTVESNNSTTAATAGGDNDDAAACPLHFLAETVVMSPEVKNNGKAKRGSNKKIDEMEKITTMPKIISDGFPDDAADEAGCEEKDGNSNSGGDHKKATKADDTVDTSIGESTEEEAGGESVNNGEKCPEEKTAPTADVVGGEEGGSDEQIPDQDQLLSRSNSDSLSKKIEEGESSTTPALDDDDVEVDKRSQSVERTKIMLETTLDDKGDAAAMDVDEAMETISTEQQPPQQNADDSSTNAIINNDDAPLLPQGSAIGTAETPTPHPNSSNNFDEESDKKKVTPPSVSQLKMALFLEASRIHTGRGGGGKPERMFAKYWDALETYIIASPHHHHHHRSSSSHLSTNRSDPTLQFNATLGIFLKSRKMKRLHNKLILALISESMRECVPVQQHCAVGGGEYIPRVWRNRTRHLQQQCKSEDDGVEEVDDVSGRSIDGLVRANWNTSFGNNADAWSACGNNGVTIAPRIDQTEFVVKKRDEKEEEQVSSDDNEIIPSCRLPGALGTDLFVKKIASDAGLTVSHDSMWLLIVAAREYASSIIGKAISNDRCVTSGQTSRIPKSDYLSLSCEHLLADRKKGKKKDTKKKESASKVANKKQGTDRNGSDTKRKVLNCADISQVLQDEQHVAAPRLAWMRSLGRGVTHHQPDLQTTNDIINTSIQRAAIERRRTVQRKIAEAFDGGNVVPVAAVEENLHPKSMAVNESLDCGGKGDEPKRKGEAAKEKRPSINMNDAATKAPPKSSDLLKSNVPTTEPTTKPSAAPPQSGLSQSVDSTATTAPAPATETVSRIRQVSKFGIKNLAAMRARRSGSVERVRREPEPPAAKEETPERLVRYQGQSTGPATQSTSQQPAPAPVSVTNLSAPAPTPTSINQSQSKEETPERLVRFQSQSARLATQSQPQQTTHAPAPASATNLSTPAPISTNQRMEETPERLVRFQSHSNGPVNQSVLQQTTPAPVSVTNLYAPARLSTSQSKEETPERLIHYQSQAAGPATHSSPHQTVPAPTPVSVANLSAPPTIAVAVNQSKDTEKLARYQQAAGPVTETSLQHLAPASASVPVQSAGLEERDKFIQSQYQQQQHKPHATSNTTQLWQETEMTMQSQVEQDDEEEVLPQPKLARTANQL